MHLAERSVVDQPAHGAKVAVPASVLVRHDDATRPLGVLHHRPRGVGGQREGLVHDHVQPGVQRAVRDVGVGARTAS